MNRRPRDRASELALALADARDRGRDSDRERVRALVNSCARFFEGAHSAKPRKLVAFLAVRLLPAAQRPRYYEEFLAEMVDLPHWQRWEYALRVLAGSWQLRRELVEATRQAEQ